MRHYGGFILLSCNGNNNIRNDNDNYSCLLLSTSYIIGTELALNVILSNL